MMDRDPDPAQMVGIADAGELQEMRRADRAAGQDDLAGRVGALDCAVVARELDADRTAAVEQHAASQRARHDLQVGPLQRRAQIGARRALPPAPAAGLLHPADTVSGAGWQMVHILMVFEADLYAGLGDLVTEERLVGGPRGQQRPALSVEFISATLPILGLLEKRQDIVPRPAAIAELPPVFEILGLAADIDHAVDRARAAQHPTARVENGAPIDARIWLRREAPG